MIAVMLVDGAVFTKYAIALYVRVPFCLYVVLNFNKAIPIKCFVSHRPPSREGGSVGRAKKRNGRMKGSEC